MRPWVLLLLLNGCSLFIGKGGTESAKGMYNLHFHSNSWQEKSEGPSDYVFENTKDGRILLSNSFCGEFQDEALEKLAGKTFNTVDKFSSKHEKYLTFHGREAFQIEGEGQVDGVQVNLKLLNTRRNNCYFDFVSISPKNISHPQASEFESFLNSVEFK